VAAQCAQAAIFLHRNGQAQHRLAAASIKRFFVFVTIALQLFFFSAKFLAACKQPRTSRTKSVSHIVAYFFLQRVPFQSIAAEHSTSPGIFSGSASAHYRMPELRCRVFLLRIAVRRAPRAWLRHSVFAQLAPLG